MPLANLWRRRLRLAGGALLLFLTPGAVRGAGRPPAAQSAPPHSRRAAADNPRQLFARGQRALAAGRLEAARRDFHAVLRLRPGLAGAEVNLGVIAERQRRWRAARMHLQRARRRAPNLAGIVLDLGLLDYRRGAYARAAGEFHAYLTRQPDSAQARYLLGLCRFYGEQYRAALRALLPLWTGQQNNLSYLYVISIAAGKARRPHLAHRAMRRMAQVGAGTPVLKLILARGYINLQQDKKALPLLRAAARQAPRLPFLHFCLGVVYQRRRKFAPAAREFQLDFSLEPDMAFDAEHLGQIDLNRGQVRRAAAWFRQALRLDPRLAGAHFGLGEARLREKRYAAALRELRIAARLAPSSGSVRYMQGRALLLAGHRRQAQLAFAAAARLRRQAQDRLQQEISGRRLPLPRARPLPPR